LRSLQPQRDLQLGSPSLIALMQRVSAATGELSESLTAQFFSYAAHTSGLSRANTLSQPL
jgi:hypothetical protein